MWSRPPVFLPSPPGPLHLDATLKWAKHGGSCRLFAKVRAFVHSKKHVPRVDGLLARRQRPCFSPACGSRRTAEEASALFPHARGRARPSDPHSEQPALTVCEWACVWASVRACSYSCQCTCALGVRVCTYTSAAKMFPPLPFLDISLRPTFTPVRGFTRTWVRREGFASVLPRCLTTSGNILRIVSCSMSVVAWQLLEARRQPAHRGGSRFVDLFPSVLGVNCSTCHNCAIQPRRGLCSGERVCKLPVLSVVIGSELS